MAEMLARYLNKIKYPSTSIIEVLEAYVATA